MLNFPKVSEIRLVKLFVHSILLMIILTLLYLLGTDLVGWALGQPIEKDTSSYASLIVVIWIFLAVQSSRYRKQDTRL